MPTKIEIMATINNHRDPISLTEIAKCLGGQPASMGSQIVRLKKEGLLDEADKDRYIISLAGELYLKEVRENAASVIRLLEPRREAREPYEGLTVEHDEGGPPVEGIAACPDPQPADSMAAEQFFHSLRLLMDELKTLRSQKDGWTFTLTDLLEKLEIMTAERDIWKDKCARWSSRITELQDLMVKKET